MISHHYKIFNKLELTKNLLSNEEYLKDKYLTYNEYVELKKTKNKEDFLAKRIAGKDTLIEILKSEKWFAYKNIEIINDNQGRPYFKIRRKKNLKAKNMYLSLSCEGDLVIAFVLVEFE